MPSERETPPAPPPSPARAETPRAVLRFNLGLAALAAYFALLVAVLNIGLIFWIRSGLAGVSAGELARTVARGTRFDAAALAMVLGPAILLYFLYGATRWSPLRRALIVYLLAAASLLPLAYSVSIQNFDERGKFMTSEPLDYVGPAWLTLIGGAFRLHPWQCTLTLLACAGLLAASWGVVRRVLAWSAPGNGPRLRWGLLAVPAWAALALAAGRGRVTGPPLSLGDSLVSGNPYLNAVCLNPVFALVRGAFGSRDPRLSPIGEAESAQTVRDLLGLEGPPQDPTCPLLRTSAGTPAGNRMNVVLFLLESWSGCDIGCLGSPVRVTPVFDALAEEGLLFTNAYATGTCSAEGTFAVLCSFPNQPQRPVLRRPIVWHTRWRPLSQILAEAGYSNIFVYGRSLTFDNTERFLGSAGFHRVIDRDDFPPGAVPIHDAWPGYSDGEVMQRALAEFDAVRDRPFFGVLYTMNTHPPFVIPAGFPLVVEPKGPANKFLNALFYSDYTLGEFFAEARRRPWFSSTVFVFVADHSRGIYGRGAEPFRLPNLHRVPILIYSPGHVRPGRDPTVASQADILPTVLGLLDLEARHAAWGRDLLNTPGRDGFAACIVGDEIHWYGGGHLLVDSLATAPPLLFDLGRDPRCLTNIARSDPEAARHFQTQARGYLSLSQRLLAENRVYVPETPDPPPPTATRQP